MTKVTEIQLIYKAIGVLFAELKPKSLAERESRLNRGDGMEFPVLVFFDF